MARKRVSEADRIRSEAEHLLQQQREVLSHAGSVIRDASRELGRYTRDEALPRAARQARSSATATRRHLVEDVMPSVAEVIGSALAAVDSVRGTASAAGRRVGKSALPAARSVKSSGAGKYVALGLGIAVVAGIGYVLWQNLRADDELWIEDEA